MEQVLPIDSIRTDGDTLTLVRVQESPEAVQRYADALAAGKPLPPRSPPMPQPDDEPLRLDERLLVETQGRINAVFQDDLLFPIYMIPSPEPRSECRMSVSGGASSLYYRDRITGWQGAGFVIETHPAAMQRVSYHGSILHEIAHCLQPELGTPWSCLPQELGFPPLQKEQIQPANSTAYQSYRFHRADFWRLAGHVWARGANAFPCRFSDLGMTWVKPEDMLVVLAPEIERMRHDPLWKIALRPVPREFETLFDFDPKDWDKFECPATTTPQEENAYAP